ncbi:DUF1003 domain-containing protein [Mesorhizobium sp. J428]|uniref:DUF1003 domain-containing protein n=1 Tax=Mesorhizobium sp. J428 TaxID=2898440 RepID=UPI0021515CB6|nr:DUF1003 domain-containing protein [Mesorhizobium sp. J428]MCR5859246.1 DUF1003 domain-containing protein [Mesorhizobium sp. J428]
MHKTIDELSTRWLQRNLDSLTEDELRVLQSAIDRRPISRDPNESLSGPGRFGDRVADAMARIGGSWAFIVSFLLFLVVWTIGNAFLLTRDAFDPYPFIFLNLILSMLAAVQAPIIMMSQNRQAARDRLDATHDYEVNLKAEIEIMALHDKLDALRQREILNMQSEITELAAHLKRIDARLGGVAS